MIRTQIHFLKRIVASTKRGRLFYVSSLSTIVFSNLCCSALAQTPGCAGPGQTPVSSTYLRQIAMYRGIIDPGMSTLTQNRRIGRSFQQFVQRSMLYPSENGFLFPSPTRQQRSGVPNLRPDFTERVTHPDGRFDDYGSFVEVKATGATLNLSYYRHQILGHIEAVSRRPVTSFGRGAARVLFITTSDTSAGPADTIAEANRVGVSLWKAVVCTSPQPGGFLQVGPAVPLNPGVYGRTGAPISIMPGVRNDLAAPGAVPVGLEDAEGGY